MKYHIAMTLLLLTGCSAKQQITPVTHSKPANVCVVKHDAVRDGVLTAITDEFRYRGITPVVINGRYELRHNMWYPTWNIPEAQSANCQSMLFYVANWSWDITTYMYFANLWMTDAGGMNVIGQATYDAGNVVSPNKWVNADSKIRELVGQMLR